jgi:hypothetical protein
VDEEINALDELHQKLCSQRLPMTSRIEVADTLGGFGLSSRP